MIIEAAEVLGVTPHTLNNLVNGASAISADMGDARRLHSLTSYEARNSIESDDAQKTVRSGNDAMFDGLVENDEAPAPVIPGLVGKAAF
jgi:hypothetical protein